MKTTFRHLGIVGWVGLCLVLGAERGVAASADAPVMDEPQGTWSGVLHQTLVFNTTCHQAIYDARFNITFTIKGPIVSGSGTGMVSQPVIVKTGCASSPQDWSAQYVATTFGVVIDGHVASSITTLPVIFQAHPTLTLHAHYVRRNDPVENETLKEQSALFPLHIPLSDHQVRSFSLQTHEDGKSGFRMPVDLIYADEDILNEDITYVGDLHKSMDPHAALAFFLAALLALLALLAKAGKKPESSELLGSVGTLVGALEALKGLGPAFDLISQQGQLGGFVLAATAEALELVRIYSRSSATGERASVTATRLALSASLDFSLFTAGALLMETAASAVVFLAPVLTPVGAGLFAAGAAALTMSALSKAGGAVKEWANARLNNN